MSVRRVAGIVSIALLTVLPLAAPHAAAQAPQAAPAPDANTILILIRTTISALNDANRTGNYTVFRDLGAPGFQQANSAARLAEIFANLRNKSLNLAPVAVVEPRLTKPAVINAQGLLHVAGVFPTRPLQVSFEMLYQRVGNEWRLFGIRVDTPEAPPANAAAQPSTNNHPPDRKATGSKPR